MFVGLLKITLLINDSGCLKSKRKVVKSLKDRIKAEFNVSVSEVADLDKWQKAVLGIACVGADKKYINGTLSRINDLVDTFHAAELIDTKMEIL